jgi:hypothetical protein
LSAIFSAKPTFSSTTTEKALLHWPMADNCQKRPSCSNPIGHRRAVSGLVTAGFISPSRTTRLSTPPLTPTNLNHPPTNQHVHLRLHWLQARREEGPQGERGHPRPC